MSLRCWCERCCLSRGEVISRKLAFTLAEVLITLGIIGVVAALTLPPLIHKHKINILETQFKKAYAIVENVNLQMLNNDINPYEDYVKDRNEEKAVKQLEDFVKFTNGAKICNNSYLGCTVGNGDDKKDHYKTLDGKDYAHIIPDSYLNKTILLPDGMTIWVGGLIYGKDRYYIDINGTKQKPNKLGYDLFTFCIGQNNIITPEKEKDYNISVDRCSFLYPAHGPNYLGFGCGFYAAANQNPDEEGKTYWQDFLK